MFYSLRAVTTLSFSCTLAIVGSVLVHRLRRWPNIESAMEDKNKLEHLFCRNHGTINSQHWDTNITSVTPDPVLGWLATGIPRDNLTPI